MEGIPDTVVSTRNRRQDCIFHKYHAIARDDVDQAGLVCAILFFQNANARHDPETMLHPLHLVRRLALPAFLLLAWIQTARSEPVAPTPELGENAASAVAKSLPTASGAHLVAASDPCFRYEGRFDRTDPAAPVIVWQASRISIDFTGDQLVFCFDGLDAQNFFDAHVDEASAILSVAVGPGQRVVFPLPLTKGRHRLMLFKRSEAAAGTARFRGIEIAAAGTVALPVANQYRLRTEFIGDSITVGACNEDGAADQWDDRRTHNNALSYGAMTAAAFDADYRNIAVSGMGVVIGWVPNHAAETWDRVYPDPKSHKADLTAWTPDIVFLNLGENDDSFSKAKGLPFPATFSAQYVALVRAIRAAHPSAEIVLLRGGMFGGAKSPALHQAWEAAVAELEHADSRVTHFVFQHWTSTHPRVVDHRAMADELIAWLKVQRF
jgi:lysophospholipase L1-like esterase